MNQGSELDYIRTKDMVHYEPAPVRERQRDRGLHRRPSPGVRLPRILELMAEDPGDDNEYMGHCLHCREEITAQGGVEWRRVVRRPCPHCWKPGW